MRKTKNLIIAILLLVSHSVFSQMVLEYDIATVNTKIAVPLWGAVNASIDWGDGSPAETVTTTKNVEHTYATTGTKTVTITGTVTQYGIEFNEAGNARLKKVKSWSGLGITSFRGAFVKAELLEEVPTTLPPGVTDLSSMFKQATIFNQSIDSWDISKVTTLHSMFWGATAFNQPLNSWDTKSVTNMEAVFRSATNFNQPLNAWKTDLVTTMRDMFQYATYFDQPIGNWNTSAVKDMFGMFKKVGMFNQPIGTWNTSSVTDMSWMFSGAYYFDQNIDAWDTSKVLKMLEMFSGTTSFNQPIGSWNTSSVQDMSQMFYNSKKFNQPIGNWDTGQLRAAVGMFQASAAFNQPLENWNTPYLNDVRAMFSMAKEFNQFLGKWDVSNVNGLGGMNDMFYDLALCTDMYDDLLVGWSTQNVKPGMKLDVGISKHSASSASAKALLESKGWTIKDGGIGVTENAKCSANSVYNISSPKINVYPNPVTDKLNIEINEVGVFTLYNSAGHEVYRTSELNNIHLSRLPKAMYTYSIQTDKNAYSGKLMLE